MRRPLIDLRDRLEGRGLVAGLADEQIRVEPGRVHLADAGLYVAVLVLAHVPQGTDARVLRREGLHERPLAVGQHLDVVEIHGPTLHVRVVGMVDERLRGVLVGQRVGLLQMVGDAVLEDLDLVKHIQVTVDLRTDLAVVEEVPIELQVEGIRVVLDHPLLDHHHSGHDGAVGTLEGPAATRAKYATAATGEERASWAGLGAVASALAEVAAVAVVGAFRHGRAICWPGARGRECLLQPRMGRPSRGRLRRRPLRELGARRGPR